jgi:heat shock protein HslJ
VPGLPTPTPLPTQTPTANIQFSASPESIQQGSSSILTWATANVQAVYLYPQGSSWQSNGVEGVGQRTVWPATTTTYELRVVNLNNSVEIRNVTVFVTPTVGAPNIIRWTAEPSQIGENQCVTLQWIVEGNVNKITIARDGTILRDGAPLSGSMQDCPPGTGDKTYTIEAVGTGGTNRLADYVRVIPASTPAPTSTPTPPPVETPTPPPVVDPVIEYFSVTPAQIALNDCVNIAWGVGGGAERVQIRRDEFIILDNAPFQGTAGDCPTAAGTYTYAVLATNSAGGEALATAIVTVSESVPDNPLVGTSWLLAAIGQGVMPPGSANITLAFTSPSQLNGSGGCNSYSASYTVSGSNISIGAIASSQLLCDEETMALEQQYFTILAGATTYELRGTLLNITSSTGERLQYNALAAATTQ